jgi:hypothetical protein
MTDQTRPLGNNLLACLPPAEYARILRHLEPVTLNLGEALCEPYVELKHVYFPVDAIVSLLCVMEDGGSAEIAVVGCEGIVGVSLFMGGETTPSRAVVQSGGLAYRLPGAFLKDEFYRGGPLQHLLLRYTQALLTQMAQTASATGITPWTSSSAAGCSSVTTGWRATSC